MAAIDFLMRILNHAIVVADERGSIVEWSPGAEALFGYTRAEIVGTPFERLVVGAQRAELAQEILASAAHPEGGTRIITHGLKQSGLPVDLEIALASWDTESGCVLGAVIRDISKQMQAERRLREGERNWQDVAENSSDVLLLLDRIGTIVFANRGFQGSSAEQLIGENAGSLSPHLKELLPDGLTRVFEHQVPFAHESRVDAPDGGAWLWFRLSPQMEDGEVVRAVLSISDVGERRARDLALRRLAAIVETTNDGVTSTDKEGRIRTWNRGAERLCGWTEAEVLGRSTAMLSPPELLETQRTLLARVEQAGQLEPHDTVCLAKGGRRIPVSVSLAAIRGEAGAFEGVSAVFRDISHYLDLQAAHERAKSAAEMASQLKSEFLANMSHEIRTPLNGVVGMTDLLLGTQLTPDQQGYVSTLLEASQALRAVVDDVLDFSRIEAGRLAIEAIEFDLMVLASGAVGMFRHVAKQNATALRLDLPQQQPLRVVGDPNRVRQVLANLVNNAVKFTKKGRVDVRILVQSRDASSWLLRAEVQDTGIGIAGPARARIFEPFAQGDGSTTRQFGGSGLGLSICRKLMELMGGSIGFESEPGKGSTFWIELGLGKATGSGPRLSAARAAPQLNGEIHWKILVAEDNAINQRVVSAMLQGLGCSVDIAGNGREALSCWKRSVYDLVLMDCQMPEMSGYDATRAIRELEGEKRIPIIAMTAQAYAEDRARSVAAGMNDHLSKPLTKAELENMLARWLLPAPAAHTRAADPGGGLDLPALRRLERDLGDGGSDLLRELVEGFVGEFPSAWARLQASLAESAWSRVVFEAHRLRSSTSNLAAVRLAALCAELEECARSEQSARAAELLSTLRAEFAAVSVALRAAVQPLPAGAPPPRRTEPPTKRTGMEPKP